MKHFWQQKFDSLYTGIRSIFFVVQKNIAPKSRREDYARREYILNCILIYSIALSGIYTISVFINSLLEKEHYRGISFFTILIIFLIYLFLFILSRKGHFLVSSYLLIFLYLVPILYCLFLWGLLIEIPLLGLALTIVMTSILINTRICFLITGIISVCIAIIHKIHEQGLIKPDKSWLFEPLYFTYVVELWIIFGVIAGITWLSNREIEKSLRRARRSEHNLQKEKDLLEIRIEERTKKLKEIQKRHVDELSRFAEFGKLSSGFFHDLINPLTAVSLNIERLKHHKSQDLEMISHQIDQTFNATERLKSFFGAIQKQLQNKSIQSDFLLSDEIYQALEILGYKAREKKVEIIFEAKQKIFTYGNPLKFHQMIVNILSNGIDAFDEITDDRKKQIRLELKQEKNQIMIEIEDCGVGIDNEVLKKIFDPLFTTKSTGTGIGLSTVKNIIEQEFDGNIFVKSIPKQKTLFTLVFPQKNKPLPSS